MKLYGKFVKFIKKVQWRQCTFVKGIFLQKRTLKCFKSITQKNCFRHKAAFYEYYDIRFIPSVLYIAAIDAF